MQLEISNTVAVKNSLPCLELRNFNASIWMDERFIIFEIEIFNTYFKFLDVISLNYH